MTGAPTDDGHVNSQTCDAESARPRTRSVLATIAGSVRDLPEAILSIAALLVMIVLGVTPWIAIPLAVPIYIGVTLLRPRLRNPTPEPVESEPPESHAEESTMPNAPSSAEAEFAARFGLTPREREILPFLAHRMTDREIAERLFKSPKTVEHQTASILGKLELDSRREVATFAARHGVTFPPIPPRLDG